MSDPRPLITTRFLLGVWVVIALSWLSGYSQQASNLFEDYFNEFASALGAGTKRCDAIYSKFSESLLTMTPTEIAAGIPVIDRHLDDMAEPQDCLAKPKEASLLMFISWCPDGAELLASQMDRLASMLNDPSHLLSAPSAMALQHIGYSRPAVVWPILEAALEAPDVNNKTGFGPGIAVVLLRMGPHGDDVTEHVAQYMRRPDLTDDQLIDTIIGIDSTPVIPDILTAELVRCLDRPNDDVKIRALVGISRSSPSAKNAARSRMEKMTNDPNEKARVRHIAKVALEGEVTEDPNK